MESEQRHCCWPGIKMEEYSVLSILMQDPSTGLGTPNAKGVERPEHVSLGGNRKRLHDIVVFDCY